MTASDPVLERRKGALATVAAFAFWGAVPLYWKEVAQIPAREMIAYRILWALPFLTAFVVFAGRRRELWRVLRQRRLMLGLLLSAALVTCNWFIFIDAVASNRVLEASLGYYINPLLNVLLGFALLGERLRRFQWFAVALAATGVLTLILRFGAIPWVALSLALTFGLYGLLRKRLGVDALTGLLVEVMVLVPLALYILWDLAQGGLARVPVADTKVQWLVPVAGLATALPLYWFSYGARRLRLATVGLVQFLAPTGQFLLAVFLFRETFTPSHALAFSLIGAGVLLYVLDLWRPRSVSGEAALAAPRE